MAITFEKIHPRTWQHPADTAALDVLQDIPMLDEVIKGILSLISERSIRLLFLSSSVRVGPKQFPKIYNMHLEACKRLDVEEIPELYVAQNPILNAGAVGVNKPFVVLNSSLIKTMSDDELFSIVGHEVGHILSGHALYKTILAILVLLSQFAVRLPVTELALQAVIYALREWDRKSELSADRAGLLCLQQLEPALSAHMKLAGGDNIGEMNLDEFFKQAEEYDSGGDMIDSIHKSLNILGATHPFPVIRIMEMKTWHAGGQYDAILNGDYLRRDKEYSRDHFKNFENAQKSYKEEMKRSNDPLTQKLNDLGENLEKAGEEILSNAKDFFDRLNQK